MPVFKIDGYLVGSRTVIEKIDNLHNEETKIKVPFGTKVDRFHEKLITTKLIPGPGTYFKNGS